MVEKLKMLFDSLCTIICNKTRLVFDRMGRLRGHFLVDYALLAPTITFAILFMIILVVQGVFQLLCYFRVLCGYFALIASNVYIILVNVWVIFVLLVFDVVSAVHDADAAIKTVAILSMIILTVQCVFHTLCFFCLVRRCFALIVSSVYMILVNVWVTFVWVVFGKTVSDLRTSICSKTRIIYDRIDRLRGHFSTDYAAVATIKTVAILFMIILTVQGVFQLLFYFCMFCGYFALLVSSVYMIFENMWVIFVLVLFGDNVPEVIERPKMLFASLCTIIRYQANAIHEMVDRLRGYSSAVYPEIAAIKIFAIFVIILTVQCVFHLLFYFCALYGYFAVVSGANITLVKLWVIFEWALCFIWNLFPEPIKAILCCLSSTTLRGVVTVFSSFSDWALNLRIDWKSFLQLFGIVEIVILWVKHGTRVICGKVFRGVRKAKRFFDYMFTVCSNQGRIILRLSGRCDAKMTVIISVVIFFAFTLTYASIFPSRHSYRSMFAYPFHLTGTYLVRVWENMVVSLDNIRLFVSKIFEPLTSITHGFWKWMAMLFRDEESQRTNPQELKQGAPLQELPQNGPDHVFNLKGRKPQEMTGKAFLQDDVIVNTNSRFISNIFEQLTSIVYVCLQWMASLLLYCLPFAAACCLLRLIWDNRIAIFYKLRMFISIIFEELTNIRFWENICVILENLCWFFSPMFEALKNLAYYCLEWITSYCTTVSFYLRKLILEMVAIFKAIMFAVFTNIRYWVNTCAILEYFSIVLRRILLIYLPASFCLAASCYFIKSMSEVVVAKLQEMMAAMLDNLRIFTAMMYEVLTNIKYWGISGAISLIAWTIITHRFRDWIYFLASYCFTVLRFALGWILTVVAGVRDSGGKIVVANLHKLPLLILKIRDALARITHRILKWITEYMYENDHCEIQEGGQPKDARRTYDKRHVDPIPPNYLLGKCAEDIESSEQHFVLPNDCRYNESSGTELESSGVTSNITLESLYCDETAEGTFNLNPGQAYERKEYREENIDVWFIDDSDHCETREGVKQRDEACRINEERRTVPVCQSSLLDKCAEENLEHHFLLPIDPQYNVSICANWESSSVTDNTALEKFYCDQTAGRPFHLIPVQANERDEGTAPLKKRNVSIDVNSMSSSLEHVSTPLSSTYQSHLISMTRKQHCEENGDLWCINDNVHSETQEAECHIYDERPFDSICATSFLCKCVEDIDHSDQHSVLPNDCQCNESSGAELESSSVTNNTTIKNLHRDESAKGKSNHNPGQPNRSDEDTPPPREKGVSIGVESVTLSSELFSIPLFSNHQNHPSSTTRIGYREENGDDGCMYDKDHCETQEGEACHTDDERPPDPIYSKYLPGKCVEDIENTHQYSVLPNDCQYNEISGAELESFSVPNNTTLENLNCDETAEVTFNLNPGQANESNEETPPSWERNVLVEVNSMTLSLEHVCTEDRELLEHHFPLTIDCQYNESSGAEWKSSSMRKNITPFNLNSGQANESDEDTPPPWERNVLVEVNSMTSSLEHVCAEDIERLMHHSPLTVDHQYNGSSDAEWKGSNITNNTTLENLHCDETAEGPVILDPGQKTESDEDTPPPWKKDVSIDVGSVTSSSELLSTPPSNIHQNLPPSTTRKGYRGKNGDGGCMYDRDPCETQEGEACHIDDERPPDPIYPRHLPGKCVEDIEHKDQHSALPNDCQYNKSSGAELESFSATNNTTSENLHCDETAKGTFNLNPGQANESDEDTPPPWERNILIDVNSMTSSLEHVCAEDIERLKHHSPLTVDRQYNGSSDAEWKGSNITNNTTLENLYCDKTAERSFILDPGQKTESDEDTPPPWERNVLVEVNSMTSSSEHVCAEDTERLENHSPLTIDRQNNAGSGAEWKSSSMTNSTTSENLHCDVTAEGLFYLNPGQANESDEDTPPPWEWNVSIDVNSMTLALEHVSTPPSPPHQSHLVPLLGKEHWEENDDSRCIYGKDHCETQEGEECHIYDERPTDPIFPNNLLEKCADIAQSEQHSGLPNDCQYNESSGAELESFSVTNNTTLEHLHCDETAEGTFKLNPGQANESDEDTPPSWERNVFIDVNTMTSSAEHVCIEDIERLEHHSPLTIDCQYNGSSNAEWKSFSITKNTTLKNLHCDDTTEGPFHLNPSRADESVILISDEDTPPSWGRNVLVDVNSMTLSLEHACAEDIELLEHHSPLTVGCQCNESSGVEWKSSSMTNNTTLENLHCDETAEGPFNLNPGDEDIPPPFSTHQSRLVSMLRKGYWQENGDVWYINDNDHSETQEAECHIIDERPVDPIFSNSFLGKCAEDIEHPEQHSVLRNDCQYNESSGIELKSASVTNNTTLKNLHGDEAAEGTFNLSHGQTSKSDEDTAPLWKRNVPIDVNRMSSSLEQVSTPLSSTYQSHLASMTRKQYREENSDVWCIDDNDHSETQEGVKLRDGAYHINKERRAAPICQSSLLYKCTEDRERLEHHFLLRIDCQYNVNTGANWESSSVTDNTVLEKFYRGETAERSLRLYPVQANECDEDTPPPWKKDVSIDVGSVTSSSELLSTPPSTIHQNLPPFTTRKGYRGKNGDDGFMYDRDPCETQEGEACRIDDERPTDPIYPRYLPGKCVELIEHKDQHSVLPNDCQYNKSSGAEFESFSVTNNTTSENLHCDETAKGTFNPNPGQANESNEETPPSWERNVLVEVNSMTLSLEHVCTEDRELLEHHFPLTIDCQYNESSGAEWKSSSMGNNVTLENFHYDETVEEPFNLNPDQANESDEDTPPPWERNILIDVNSMTLSLEHVCAEDIERLKHHSPLTVDRQYNESSGAEWKGSNITNNTTLENFHCDETAEGPVILNPGQETESDEDTPPPGERNVVVDVNSMTSSLGYVCVEDLERLEHHSPLTIDYQCNEISGAELENSSVTNNTTLESLHCDVTAKGPFHLIPGQANESDRDTPSPWERNILIDVDRMTSSLEHVRVKYIERLEHPSPLTIDCQYNESSSVGWKGSSFTNNRTLENLHIDETAEGSLNLNPSQADKSDEDTLPPWERSIVIDVNSMTSSLEHVCAEDVERLEDHSPLTIDCQYDESGGTEWKRSSMTDKTTLEYLHCVETAEGPFNLNPGLANESDEDTPSPRERKVLINVNSMTLSSEHMCREDIERLEHHSPLAIDCQYNESSGTEWKSFRMTNNKTLGNLQWDETAEGPFNLNPGGANESDEDTLPPREWNVSIDVNSMTLSLGHVSTPSSCPHQSHLVSLLGKEYWEENGDFRCIYGKDHRETQEGEECHIYDERPTDPNCSNNLLDKCAEDIEHSEQYSVLPNDCQYNESSGAELEGSSVTNNTTLEYLHCDETPEGTFNLNAGQANESDEDTPPPWEMNFFIDVNTMTSSSEHLCTDDIGRLEHHSPLTIDCQYNEGSGATWKSSSIPNNTKLENLHRDETAEGTFHLNPSQADESDEDTPSPGDRNVLVHVNSMTLSSEQVYAEDIELSEHHSPLTVDCQYNESSGAEWKISSMTNITALENIHCHETAEGPFNFDPGRANESDEDTPSPSSTHQSHLVSMLRKGNWKENGDVWCINDNDHCEAQVGEADHIQEERSPCPFWPSSLLGRYSEGIESVEYHCFLPDHGQYNMTSTTLSLELRSGICAARFGELLPFSTPHCFTYLNHPLFTTREWCWEDNFKVGCIYEKGRYETQKGATLRYEACHILEERPTAHIWLNSLLVNSLLGEYSEGYPEGYSESIEYSEHHRFFSSHLQYDVTSGAEWEMFGATEYTALEMLCCGDNVGGPFKFNAAQSIGSDPHTLPPWVIDVSTDVNRVALSLEPRSEIYAPSLGELLPFSTSPCFTYLNHPLSTLWECYCEENPNRSITYDNDHSETQKGATLRYEVCYIQEERSTAHISLNSLLGEYSGGLECSGPRCFQPCHLQYNVTSGAEWKILEATDNTVLEELYCEGSIGGLFKLNSAQVIESDPHTLPPWVFDVSTDVNRVALSLEPRSEIYAPSFGELFPSSTSPCFTYLNHPLSTLWECYCEENLNRSITYDNDRSETQKGATLRYEAFQIKEENSSLGEYSEGIECLEHHYFQPHHLQYNVISGAEWKILEATDNTALEELYCDENIEGLFKLNSAQAIERETLPPWDNDVSIEGINITSSSEQTSGNYALSFGNLRQLSTPPCSTYQNNPLPTTWKWYSEEVFNVGCMYNKELLGGNLREPTEQACFEELPQNAKDYKFNFKAKDQRASSGNSISIRVPEKRPVVPSHWSYTPVSEPYTRVTLDSSSWEFKEVEQLFKASMSNVVIKKIDRVQNPFMWENFQRKKDYMTAIAHGNEQMVNEKRLFHGTSPDSVKAICKENFDCRLSGSANGTSYGHGSYFAVNASLSHWYTQADANKSRFMFLAKVLAGSYVIGDPSYRRPPPKEPSDRVNARYYDSCVDDESEPTMFIVFDIDQHYPEYVIQYQSD